MNSILTNAASLSALQNLRSIGTRMLDTQTQASSGLRIQAAADNAAYWSISTTMRSDNKALSAVADALGLGGAMVDVAYTGTESIIQVLDDVKMRLVAAREPGVDKAKIQLELEQLKAQAKGIVASSSFNSVNWLTTNAPDHLMETGPLTTSIVSSFVRSADGSVSVKQIDVNLKDTSMLNFGGGGILQKELYGVSDIGGFRGTGMNSTAHEGHESHVFTGPATFNATDYIEFDLVVDAGTHSAGTTSTNLRIDKTVIDAALGTTDGKINTGTELRAVLQRVFTNNSVPATANEMMFTGSTASNYFEIGSLETSGNPGSSIDIANVTSSFAGNFALGIENAPNANHDNMYPEASITFTKPFTVSAKAGIYFDVQVGAGSLQTYTIDRTTVDSALGTSDGSIGSASDLATVIAYASSGSGLSVVASGSTITFGADQTIYPEAGNRAARVYLGNVQSTPRWALEFDLAEVDVTTASFTTDEYIDGVDYMLQRAISSAATLGAHQQRIEIQSDFTEKLMDTLSMGIGRLVDADMNEVSTRLKALQTQEQLATQALQIANSASDQMLKLFG